MQNKSMKKQLILEKKANFCEKKNNFLKKLKKRNVFKKEIKKAHINSNLIDFLFENKISENKSPK